MGANSKIEWCHDTFNPWEGCSKVSAGCANCYAEERANRFKTVVWGPGGTRKRTSPANWRKPILWNRIAEIKGERRRVFCASLADVFEDRPELETWRADLFKLITETPNLDWLLLTKRPENIIPQLSRLGWDRNTLKAYDHDLDANNPSEYPFLDSWPEPNVWIGTSVENQEQADKRIPELLEIPAKVRFLSMEPLLGPVDIGMSTATCKCCDRWPSRWVNLTCNVQPDFPFLSKPGTWASKGGPYLATSNQHGALCVQTPGGPLGIKPDEFKCLPKLDWVIVGGESGKHARPMHPDWVRDIRDQCQAAGVPLLFKQWGEWFPRSEWEDNPELILPDDNVAYGCPGPGLIIEDDGLEIHVFHKVGKHAAGRILDGRSWDEVPEADL